MLYPPTVVVVDDREDELDTISRALRSLDVSCLAVLANGVEVNLEKPLTGVRLIFFDINYLPGIPTKTAMYETAATVLLKVLSRDNGPYILVTWTSKPEEHAELMAHFAEHVAEIPAPAISACLPKEKFTLTGKDAGKGKAGGPSLKDAIQQMWNTHPQIAGLMQWELSARKAAGDVVSSLLELFPRRDRFSGQCGDALEALLTHMATSAVGKANVPIDRLGALNEALGPILFDRIMHQQIEKETATLWEVAIKLERAPVIGKGQPPLLNALSHYALPSSGPMLAGDRGVVFTLSENTGETVAQQSGLELKDLLDEFLHAHNKAGKPKALDLKEIAAECLWVLIGTRASCDQAQGNGFLKPAVLGLELPANSFGATSTVKARKHEAAFSTPPFTRILNGTPHERKLLCNWHWTMSLSPTQLEKANVLYRLREPLINQLASKLAGYMSRPGIITF